MQDSRIPFGRGRFLDLDEMPPAFIASYRLLRFVEGNSFTIDTPLQQLLVATFHRSSDTFRGFVAHLLDDLPIQAAMLARSLFEDVVVGHWLLLNADDPDWLVKRFMDHRDAMALYQLQLERDTAWRIGLIQGVDLDSAVARQNELSRFGGKAQRNWWDPGEDGRGGGRPIGLDGVAGLIEDAAAERRMFYPRFAGGEKALLRPMEQVAQKWFTQCLHHTAVGLPIVVGPVGQVPDVAEDASFRIGFIGWWLFAQQLYLLHDLYDQPYDELNEVFRRGLVEGFGATEGDLK